LEKDECFDCSIAQNLIKRNQPVSFSDVFSRLIVSNIAVFGFCFFFGIYMWWISERLEPMLVLQSHLAVTFLVLLSFTERFVKANLRGMQIYVWLNGKEKVHIHCASPEKNDQVIFSLRVGGYKRVNEIICPNANTDLFWTILSGWTGSDTVIGYEVDYGIKIKGPFPFLMHIVEVNLMFSDMEIEAFTSRKERDLLGKEICGFIAFIKKHEWEARRQGKKLFLEADVARLRLEFILNPFSHFRSRWENEIKKEKADHITKAIVSSQEKERS
jgi:hypothetical protein